MTEVTVKAKPVYKKTDRIRSVRSTRLSTL